MSDPQALYDVLRYIRPIHQCSARLVTDSLAGGEVTMPMRAVLERVFDDGPQTVPQLARSLWLTRQAVQRIVDEALAAGYVDLRVNPAHRRSRLVGLTPAGRTVYTQLHDAELARLRPIAGELSAAEIGSCVRVLAHLSASLRGLLEETAGDEVAGAPRPTASAKERA